MSEPTPDGVPCRHCRLPIFWDDICWVHANGFADCHLVVSGGTAVADLPPDTAGMEILEKADELAHERGLVVTVDPELTSNVEPAKQTYAEPEGEWL